MTYEDFLSLRKIGRMKVNMNVYKNRTNLARHKLPTFQKNRTILVAILMILKNIERGAITALIYETFKSLKDLEFLTNNIILQIFQMYSGRRTTLVARN